MAFNILDEIALKAFNPNEEGVNPATAPAICQENYSGDLQPKATNKKAPMNMPLGQNPFSWPDMNPKKRKSPPDQQRLPTGSANPVPASEQSNKRTNPPNPWDYCNNCWNFGEHHSESCTKPPAQRPLIFNNVLNSIRKTHVAVCTHFKRQKHI